MLSSSLLIKSRRHQPAGSGRGDAGAEEKAGDNGQIIADYRRLQADLALFTRSPSFSVSNLRLPRCLCSCCHELLEGSHPRAAGTKDKGLLLSSPKPDKHFRLLSSSIMRFYFSLPLSLFPPLLPVNPHLRFRSQGETPAPPSLVALQEPPLLAGDG